MKKVPGDLIALTLVSQFAEFFAMTFSGWIYPKLGDKWGLILFLGIAATGNILLMGYWESDSPKLILLFVIIGKFGITAAFNVVFIAWALLIPTAVSTTTFGYVNIIARVFNSLSSLLAEADYHVSISYNLICCLASAIAACLLVTN